MVTNPKYKTYSSQIAELFCSEQQNSTLCKASLIERLNTYLDDFTYPYFLAKLNQGRFYITNFENFQNGGFRIVVIDLITGERQTAWWEIPYRYPYLGKLPAKLLASNYNIISANKTYSEADRFDYRITWNPIKPSYGITFVPGSVGGSGSTGGGSTGGGSTGGGGQIVVTPEPIQTPKQQASNFDFGELLSNPIVLIGGGIVLFLLMKDKF